MSDEQQSAQVADGDDTVVAATGDTDPAAETVVIETPAEAPAEVPAADATPADATPADATPADATPADEAATEVRPTAAKAGRPRASTAAQGGSGLGKSRAAAAKAKSGPAKSGPAKSGPAKSGPAKSGTAGKAKNKAAKPEAESAEAAGPLFSGYGLASAALGVLAVCAVVFGAIIFSSHRSELNERSYRSRVLQTAAGWTHLLINLNAQNVEKGMERLRDKTVGPLNSEFDSSIEPFRKVVQQIQSKSVGKIESVVIEATPDVPEGGDADRSPSGLGRTDPVLVVAASVAENVGGKPQIVHWTLHLDVTDVDGQLKISQLWPVR